MPRQRSASPWVVVCGVLVLACTALPLARAQNIDGPLRDRLRDSEAGRDRLIAQAVGLQAAAPATAGAPVWPQALVALRVATLDAFDLVRAARGGAPALDLAALERLAESARSDARALESAKEQGKDLEARLAEAEAKRAARRPGAGWPFPIGSLINFFTEAPWWAVVLVALPLVACGIGALRRLAKNW
jgi:hypothetical protein